MTGTDPAANKALVRDYFEAWDGGDPDAIARCFSDDFSTTYTGWQGETVRVDPEDVRDWIVGWQEVIDELNHEVHDLVAEGDLVMARVTYRGVHAGSLYGIEPTGQPVEVTEFLRFRIEAGEIIDLEWLGDDLALLRQLGVDLPIGS